jgi:hypothetical protein
VISFVPPKASGFTWSDPLYKVAHMESSNKNFIIRNLDEPVQKDWIFWLWLFASAASVISVFNQYNQPNTAYDSVALLIDLAFGFAVQWFIFNWIPRTIRLKMRNR